MRAMKQIPVAILVRVSTDAQANDRQISELREYADRQGYTVVEVIEEKVSGLASREERHGLNRAHELAVTGAIKKILVHEVTRISRKSSVIHTFVEQLEAAGCSIYWRSQNLETLLPDGRRSPAAMLMMAIFAEMGRTEVDQLRDRVNSGLAEARRKGVTLGRPQGSTVPPEVFLASHSDVVRQLKAGQSIRHAAKITGKSPSTVQRVRVMIGGLN